MSKPSKTATIILRTDPVLKAKISELVPNVSKFITLQMQLFVDASDNSTKTESKEERARKLFESDSDKWIENYIWTLENIKNSPSWMYDHYKLGRELAIIELKRRNIYTK